MYALTIALGGTAMAWKFLFKTQEAADSAYAAATNSVGHPHTLSAPLPTFEVRDDFGQSAKFTGNVSVLLENLDESRVAHVENALHEMRTRAAIQQRAQGDSSLRFAMNNGPGGPAVISPMGGRM
jgi:hypothetical protein